MPKKPTKAQTPSDLRTILADIQHAENVIRHWKRTLGTLQNKLASAAGTLLASVDYVAKLCPPESKDQIEAIEDIRSALQTIMSITEQIQKL
jgi:hypothetical protein